MSRINLAIVSFALALLFVALDVFDINLMFGRTSVSIYPVAFFALVGAVLLARPLLDRSARRDRQRQPDL